jgi:hypothetical protein
MTKKKNETTSLELLLDQILLVAKNTNDLIKKNAIDPALLANILKNLSDSLTKLEKIRNRKLEKEELLAKAIQIEELIFASQTRNVEASRRQERKPIIFDGEQMTAITEEAIKRKAGENQP